MQSEGMNKLPHDVFDEVDENEWDSPLDDESLANSPTLSNKELEHLDDEFDDEENDG